MSFFREKLILIPSRRTNLGVFSFFRHPPCLVNYQSQTSDAENRTFDINCIKKRFTTSSPRIKKQGKISYVASMLLFFFYQEERYTLTLLLCVCGIRYSIRGDDYHSYFKVGQFYGEKKKCR